MSVFTAPDYDSHQLVQFVHDPETGLRAIIALHRIAPGASGGVRMKPYASEADAIRDALRLSRAMSYKWAFTGIRLGGGKTVVIGDPARDKTQPLLHALGSAIEALGGQYFCGSDVGTGPEDMRVIRETTSFVRGADPDHGDSSEATAYGVLQGIRAAAKWKLGRDNLDGVHVAVQGVGHVGGMLCEMLAERGARLTVADVNAAAVQDIESRLGAQSVGPDEILTVEADILAPCALGGVLNEASIPALRALIVCGGANNQLNDDADAARLHARGILFVPDYAVNSGGIINGVAEGPNYDKARVWRKLERINERCLEVFDLAEKTNVSAQAAADALCELEMRRLETARH